MEKCRAKFTVAEVARFSSGGRVKLTTQYDSTIPEDVSFNKATPNGSIEMYIDNPPALEFFEPGKAYYIDVIKAA